jgi:hypothetical protein
MTTTTTPAPRRILESLTQNLPTTLRGFTPLELWLLLSYTADELALRPELELRGAAVVVNEALSLLDPFIARTRLEGQNRPQAGERPKASS